MKIPESIIRKENKKEVLEAAYAYLYNDLFFGEEVPDILKDEPKLLEFLGVYKIER